MPAENHWASMSFSPEDLAAAGRALAGRDLAAPAVTQVIQPPSHLMSRLLHWHRAAGHLAATAPEILAHPEIARTMEDELVRAMVACLTDRAAEGTGGVRLQQVRVMRRFERVLEANQDRPIYLTEVCAAIGVSGRYAPHALPGAFGNEPAPLSLVAADESCAAYPCSRRFRREHCFCHCHGPRLWRTGALRGFIPKAVRRDAIDDAASCT